MPLIIDDIYNQEEDCNAPARYIDDMLSSTTTVEATARLIVDNITNAHHPVTKRHRFWDIFFAGVIFSDRSHELCVDLLLKIRAHPSTTAKRILHGCAESKQLHWKTLPDFHVHWRELYDRLYSRRDRLPEMGDGSENGIPSGFPSKTNCNDYLRFVEFSAKALRWHVGHIHPYHVFAACRDVLEQEGPKIREEQEDRLTSEDLWVLDVTATSSWVIFAAGTRFEMNSEMLRSQYEDELDAEQELWPRTDGLTRDRWLFWDGRFRGIAQYTAIGESSTEIMAVRKAIVKEVVIEAAEVIRFVLDVG